MEYKKRKIFLNSQKVENLIAMDFGLCHKETSMILMEYTSQKRAKINLVDTMTSKVNMFLHLQNTQHNNKKKINKDKKLGVIIEIKYSFRKQRERNSTKLDSMSYQMVLFTTLQVIILMRKDTMRWVDFTMTRGNISKGTLILMMNKIKMSMIIHLLNSKSMLKNMIRKKYIWQIRIKFYNKSLSLPKRFNKKSSKQKRNQDYA